MDANEKRFEKLEKQIEAIEKNLGIIERLNQILENILFIRLGNSTEIEKIKRRINRLGNRMDKMEKEIEDLKIFRKWVIEKLNMIPEEYFRDSSY